MKRLRKPAPIPLVRIYDVNIDEMRVATQGDVDEMQGAIQMFGRFVTAARLEREKGTLSPEVAMVLGVFDEWHKKLRIEHEIRDLQVAQSMN